MKNVLIIGGGLAGCTVAQSLSKLGVCSVILEASPAIGGKVIDYGCKADDECNQCGVCSVGNLWETVRNDDNIEVLSDSNLVDLWREGDVFSCYIKHCDEHIIIKATDIVVSSGFSSRSASTPPALEYEKSRRILSGINMESIIKQRSTTSLFSEEPESVAFVLCYGSRSVKDKAQYCSQVCCSYASRMAKVIRHYYVDCKITFFYMDLQSVGNRHNNLRDLEESGVRLIRCRPAKITFKQGLPEIIYEDRGNLLKEQFDYVVLCEGVHPNVDNVALSNITGLRVGKEGFLEHVRPPETTQVHIAGCAAGPQSIKETVAQSQNVAMQIAKLKIRAV